MIAIRINLKINYKKLKQNIFQVLIYYKLKLLKVEFYLARNYYNKKCSDARLSMDFGDGESIKCIHDPWLRGKDDLRIDQLRDYENKARWWLSFLSKVQGSGMVIK